MPSHMSSIGFPIQNIDEMKALGKRAVADARETYQVPGVGYYRRWSPGSGVEIWVHVTEKMEIVGMEPHFSGNARMKVRLSKRILGSKNAILEGSFYSWANPHRGVTDQGDYPFCFTAPNFRLHDGMELPREVPVQLAAFPHELLVFDNREQVKSSNTWMKQMASESCIPTGLFLPGGQKKDPPMSEIMFSGTVQETSPVTNPVTGQSFVWAKVRTLGGELDLVADPAAVKGTIKKKSIVGSTCWLSGIIK